MQQYETVIILTPLLSEEAVKEVTTKFTKLLKDSGAEIIQEDNWGLKKLAYPIHKKTTGYYHLTEFKAPGEIISKLELEYKRDERIMRFLTVSLDKHAIIYNERKLGGAFNKKKPAPANREDVPATETVTKPRRAPKVKEEAS
jgi:small subunit ribosomal protein S6